MLFSSCLPRLIVVVLLASPAAFAFRPATPPSLVRLARHNNADVAAEHKARSQACRSQLRMAPTLLEEDDKVKVFGSPKITRDWVWNEGQDDEFTSYGEFGFEVHTPKSGTPQGVVFFMHGFSQYPVAYRETMKNCAKEAGVAVVAVDTGFTSDFVKECRDNKPSDETMSDNLWSQFVLQRALSEDTKQCIRMVSSGDSNEFDDYSLPKDGPFGVAGHSMGGGLSFPVAADAGCDYVFTMAPYAGVDAFNPITAASKGTIAHSMLLAGKCDLIAGPTKVEPISKAINDAASSKSSVYVAIDGGLHTGFEDKLVLFGTSLYTAALGVCLALGLENILEKIGVVREWRRETGQLDGSRYLMAYFFGLMAQGKGCTPMEAKIKVRDETWAGKFHFKYGGDSS